jgi:hypothetical protein
MVGTAQMRLCPSYGLSVSEKRAMRKLVGILKSWSDKG